MARSRSLGREHRTWSYRPQASSSASSLLLDQVSVAPLCAYSFSRKLRSAYAGAAFRVRRSSDNTEQDIGFSGTAVDFAALASFCSGTTGFVRTWYSQGSTAGRDLRNTTAGNQPRIYSGGATDAMTNGTKGCYFPTAASTHLLSTGGGFSAGLTGNPGITVAWAFDRVSGEERGWEFGLHSAGRYILFDAEIARECFIGNGTGYRSLDYNNAVNVPHSLILKIAASSTVSAWEIEEAGTNLTQLAVASGATTLNLGGASNDLVIGNWAPGDDSHNGHFAAYMIWDSLLGSTDLGYLRTEMANYA
jgi:hypothetical protein